MLLLPLLLLLLGWLACEHPEHHVRHGLWLRQLRPQL
jgi:hypothetical protein